MNCYLCQLEADKLFPAVAVCQSCGAGICESHLIQMKTTQVVGMAGNGAPRSQVVCCRCYAETPSTHMFRSEGLAKARYTWKGASWWGWLRRNQSKALPLPSEAVAFVEEFLYRERNQEGSNVMSKRSSAKHHALKLHAAGYSGAGRFSQPNEDAFALYDVSDAQQANLCGKLYLIADGTGNHAAAQAASRIAIETVPAVYYSQNAGDAPLRRLQHAFFAAHAHICDYAASHEELREMATTCTAVVVKENRAWVAHIGDSRVYLIRPSSQIRPSMTRITTDHSLAAGMIRAGELEPSQMRSVAHRDIFLKALGNSKENNPYPDFAIQQVRSGDVLLLCSDGLWSALKEDDIIDVVSALPAQKACEELVHLAKDVGGDENISVILLSFSE